MNYILYGEDSYLLQQELDKILKEHLGNEVELNTTTYSAIQTSMNEILDDAMTIPFFGYKGNRSSTGEFFNSIERCSSRPGYAIELCF